MDIKEQKKLDLLLSNAGNMVLKREARRIIEELDPKNGDRILDVGCGDGYYLFLLSNLGLKVQLFGCDFDINALKSAKNNLLKITNKVILKKGDLMEKLPFKSSYFDKIIMSQVAEHLPNDLKGLKEVSRVLKKNGILCLSVPNSNYPMFWDPVNWFLEKLTGNHIKSGFWAGIWNQHLRLYKREEIKNVIEKANFKIQLVEGITSWCLPFNHYLINYAARLCYGQKLNEVMTKDLAKFSIASRKRTVFVKLLFGIVNFIDKLNDVFPKEEGVSVFIKAIKKNGQ